MPFDEAMRPELRRKLEQYEGRLNHLYLDSRGRVTVGVGHLVENRNSIANVTLYQTRNGQPYQPANLQLKLTEYDNIAALPWGRNHGAASFQPHTSLVMRAAEIDQLLNNHIDSFYTDLTNIYNPSNGYHEDFDNFHRNVKFALFDMIFNLGATRIVNRFPDFNAAIKSRDWWKAASESNRPDVNANRNHYVKNLLNTTPMPVIL